MEQYKCKCGQIITLGKWHCKICGAIVDGWTGISHHALKGGGLCSLWEGRTGKGHLSIAHGIRSHETIDMEQFFERVEVVELKKKLSRRNRQIRDLRERLKK